eukprot:6317049-Lingulodinium_polyedra.AAC.1
MGDGLDLLDGGLLVSDPLFSHGAAGPGRAPSEPLQRRAQAGQAGRPAAAAVQEGPTPARLRRHPGAPGPGPLRAGPG